MMGWNEARSNYVTFNAVPTGLEMNVWSRKRTRGELSKASKLPLHPRFSVELTLLAVEADSKLTVIYDPAIPNLISLPGTRQPDL